MKTCTQKGMSKRKAYGTTVMASIVENHLYAKMWKMIGGKEATESTDTFNVSTSL